MTRREELEILEQHELANYATKSSGSRGRAFREDEHPYRTAFQRDRDRVLHTTAFRRLGHKTQVFVTYEGDYYRTRLTHSLETAQIARTIARALQVNEDLTEAIALAHDLGHPPFGHAGESRLNRLMEAHGGFDHNAQSVRIVTLLERRYPEFAGLNLTWEVLEGMIKHETEYDRSNATGFDPEVGTSLEAQIVNLADEIAYNTHDLDDGLRSRLLGPDEVELLKIWQEALETVGEPYSEMVRHRAIRRLIDWEVTDVINSTGDALAKSAPGSPEEVRQLEGLVRFSPKMEQRNRELKDFLYGNLYRQHRVVRMQSKAERFVQELFEAYLTEPDQLPPDPRSRIEEEGLPRAACDYIAGMTDRFALQEHEKLFQPWERT
ncbi:MAG: deoxyguanosinetriphosphate triphosphohydrolase [Anaerolineae bacterium]